MKTNIVEIFYAGKNFSAHVPKLPGCISTGNTPDEIKTNIHDAIVFHLAGIKEDGEKPPVSFRGKYELVFKFDAQSLLKYYKNVITGSALEKYSGINQKQLNHYANLHRKPRVEQLKKIQLAFHNLGKELMAVELQTEIL
jgi:predicted RNase H-like HicB family nuclease